MSESLSAFAPLRCTTHGLLDGGRTYAAEATTLFVDLVGFTPLTDALGRFGSRGTEQLSDIIQSFFGSATERALKQGGDPIAFGGDALTIIFDGDASDTVAAARTLADTLHELSREVSGTSTLAGRLTLQTRIGIARGGVSTSVARTAGRAIPVHLGAGLDLAVEAEGVATSGQVQIHPSASHVEGRARTEESLAPKPAEIYDAEGTSEELTRLLNPAVVGHLLSGSRLWESHRTASVAFAGFPPLETNEQLQFMRTTTKLLENVNGCGGEVVQVSGGDKGIVAFTVFGAPVGHDDDPLRAVQAMLELRRLVPSVKVGIATGPVFASMLGSERRRFQAHFGRVVNIAARLMQAAEPHEVIVDTTTWHAAGGYLRQRDQAQSLSLKGQPDPLEVWRVVGWRRRRRQGGSQPWTLLVGREPETELIEELLDGLQEKRGGSLVFQGDPGVGKSRLAREAVIRAATRDLSVLEVDAADQPYGQMGGFWRELLGGALGIPATAKRSVWQTTLSGRVPDDAGGLNALDPILEMNLHGRDVAAQADPNLAIELAQTMLERVFAANPDNEPLLVVVENAHHLPDASRSLLIHLEQHLGKAVAVLVTERTPAGLGAVPGAIDGGVWRLNELSDAASASVADDTWRQSGGGSPPPWLAPLVRRQAGGNPLFLRAATNRILHRWQPGEPPPEEVPDADLSLTNVLSERLDLLEVPQRRVLALLAVSKRPCSLATALDVLSDQVNKGVLLRAIRELDVGQFIRVLPGSSGERYRIRHDLLQRLVYEQMSYADRVQMHRSLGRHLSAHGAGAEEIADHVRHLDDTDMKRHWFPLAAAKARSTWNIAQSLEWWRLALPLLDPQQREEADVELLELQLVSGQATDVFQAYQGRGPKVVDRVNSANRVLADRALETRRLLVVAEAALSSGEFVACEQVCARVMELTQGSDERRYQQSAELMVRSLCDRGKMSDAVAIARIQLERAERAGDRSQLTTANASLGAALLYSGMPTEAAEYYETARRSAHSTVDPIHETHVLSDLAGCAYEAGDYPLCLKRLGQARELADSIGYRRHLMYNLSNEAQLRAGLGDVYAARCAQVAVQRSLDLGDLAVAANALHTWMSSKAELMTDFAEWLRLASIDVRLGRTTFVADGYANAAVAAARQGDSATVRSASEEALRLAESGEGAERRRRVELANVILSSQAIASDDEAAGAELVQKLAALAKTPEVGTRERAELHLEIWRIAPSATAKENALGEVTKAFTDEPSAVVRSWFGALGAPEPTDAQELPPPVGITGAAPGPAELDAAFSAVESELESRTAHSA